METAASDTDNPSINFYNSFSSITQVITVLTSIHSTIRISFHLASGKRGKRDREVETAILVKLYAGQVTMFPEVHALLPAE